jgi:hypothetical protein
MPDSVHACINNVDRLARMNDDTRRVACFAAQDTIVESFDPGSSYGLKDVLTVKNQRRVVNFYHQ